MRKRTDCEVTENTFCVDTKQLQRLTNSGYQTAVKIGVAANARIQIGKRVLWNTEKIKRYLEDACDTCQIIC